MCTQMKRKVVEIMRIAFIGTGVMGGAMAKNLMDGGHTLSVYTRTKAKAEALIAAGARWNDTIADCVADAQVVITMVGFPKDVEAVYLGAGGIVESAPEGAVLIDMTTTSPALSKRIYAAAKDAGLSALDAPVSGGDSGAQKGTLSIMAGGDREVFDAMVPVFEAMGSSIIYEGGAGTGQHTKMANQIAIAGAISGVCEAIAYGRKTGLDLNTMLDSIGAGAAGSWQMANLAPKMLAGDYAPGFYIKHIIKDLKIADEEARSRSLELDVLEDALHMYETLADRNLGELGTQALIRYFDEPES
jgi:3-hydroxyisobutyrate dehydrogenase